MSSADWEEVKRLAADFQRAQLTSASQRLTERNCIEIMNRLIEMKLLDVVFTSDGKEYVTPQQLTKEIQDELYVHGGRLSLVTLATNLNVSLSIIEARVQELVKHDRHINLVLGQIITSNYIDGLCEDLNERLTQDGMISLSEISKTSDLPGDFLQDQIQRRLGKVIHGKQDKDDTNLIYTEAFVRRNTARVRGILSAVTKPTPINQIMMKLGSHVPEKVFFNMVEKLIAMKRIEGLISGGGSSRSAYYIPSAHSKAQIQWIDGFMNGNGYVDLDAAARLGISDPKSFISKRFPNQNLLFLKTCVLGESLFDQAKEQVTESLTNPGWVDMTSILPASVTDQDVQILMDKVLVGVKDATALQSMIVSKKLLDELKKLFQPLMSEKAGKDISSGRYIQLVNETRAAEKKLKMAELEDTSRGGKKDERRKKAASGKAGGGTQGRETKTKATKKKYMAGKKDEFLSDSEEETLPVKGSASGSVGSSSSTSIKKGQGPLQLEFQSLKDIQKVIAKHDALSEAPTDFLESVSQLISGGLQDEYQMILKDAFDKFMSEKCGKKSLEEVLEKLFKMTTMFQLYVEGLNLFEGDVKNQLEKFLLKSYGQEIVVAATTFLFIEAGLDENSQISDLPNGKVKDALTSLGKSADIQAFLDHLGSIVPPVKKSSKSTLSSKNILLESRETLMNEMESAESSDPALFLHIATLILFSLCSDALLQASGKFVPQIITFLGGKLGKEEHAQLKECQEGVVALIKMKNGPGAEEARENLYSSALPAVKKIIQDKKK